MRSESHHANFLNQRAVFIQICPQIFDDFTNWLRFVRFLPYNTELRHGYWARANRIVLFCRQMAKFQLDYIQNGRLSAILTLICLISCNPCQIAKPLLWNKMCGFRKRYALKKFNSSKYNIADYWLLLILICMISGKRCLIARPLPWNKICGFREGYALKIFNLIKFKITDYYKPLLTFINRAR